MRIARSTGVALALLVMCVVLTARADGNSLLVADGDAFSIDLASTSGCFMAPAALRERVPCEKFDPARADALDLGALKVIALALVPLETSSAKVLLTLGRVPNDKGVPIEANLELVRHQLEASFQQNLGGPGTAHVEDLRIVRLHDLPVLRTSTMADGIPEDDPRAHVLEYQGGAIFYAKGVVYMLTVGGQKADRAEIDDLVQRLAMTVKLKTPETEPREWQKLVLRIGGGVVIVVAGGVLVWRRRRPLKKKKRKKHAAT